MGRVGFEQRLLPA